MIENYIISGFDRIDNNNQRVISEFREVIIDTHLPMDRVSGYTIKQLEVGLKGAQNWTQWRDNIRNRHDNPTEQFLDELFNNWAD